MSFITGPNSTTPFFIYTSTGINFTGLNFNNTSRIYSDYNNINNLIVQTSNALFTGGITGPTGSFTYLTASAQTPTNNVIANFNPYNFNPYGNTNSELSIITDATDTQYSSQTTAGDLVMCTAIYYINQVYNGDAIVSTTSTFTFTIDGNYPNIVGLNYQFEYNGTNYTGIITGYQIDSIAISYTTYAYTGSSDPSIPDNSDINLVISSNVIYGGGSMELCSKGGGSLRITPTNINSNVPINTTQLTATQLTATQSITGINGSFEYLSVSGQTPTNNVVTNFNPYVNTNSFLSIITDASNIQYSSQTTAGDLVMCVDIQLITYYNGYAVYFAEAGSTGFYIFDNLTYEVPIYFHFSYNGINYDGSISDAFYFFGTTYMFINQSYPIPDQTQINNFIITNILSTNGSSMELCSKGGGSLRITPTNINSNVPINTPYLNVLQDISCNTITVTGTATAPTPPNGDNSTNIATTAFVQSAKSFVIDHPVDPEKHLVHVCLEGPEAGVYYRGESSIKNNEYTIVTLPDYVDHFATNFTVQLTPIYPLTSVSTSRVENGSFKVYGSNGSFYWIVYGERHKINVEPNKCDVILKGEKPYQWVVSKLN
jgi:hypothetical protein